MATTTSKKSALDLVNELILELELAAGSSSSASGAGASAGTAKTAGDKTGKSSSAEKKEKQTKPPKEPKAAAPAPAAADANAAVALNVNSLDLRVGLITKVWRHETAEKLFCEEIDVGEAEPRQVASGLVPHYSLEEMQGRRLIVICNLKPRNLVGFKSCGMVLCAAKPTSDGHEKVEFVDPPANAKVGERIVGTGLSNEPVTQAQCDKKKVFETIAPDLRVDENGVCVWNGIRMIAVACGEQCVAPTLRDAQVR
jgi:aminoacyl tRNA synthase complex-interacting multifunctional protein 1